MRMSIGLSIVYRRRCVDGNAIGLALRQSGMNRISNSAFKAGLPYPYVSCFSKTYANLSRNLKAKATTIFCRGLCSVAGKLIRGASLQPQPPEQLHWPELRGPQRHLTP